MSIDTSRYPTGAKIKRMVTAAEQAGIKVGAIEIARDGMIRILAECMVPSTPANNYDTWKARREIQ